LKPLTGVGSSLILKCHNDREALKNFHFALKELPRAHYQQLRMASHKFRTLDGRLMRFRPRSSMLVEQYIDGREASVECLVVGGTVLPLVVHDKIGMQEAKRVVFEHLLIAPPERFTSAEITQMRRYAVEVIRAIGLKNTFCHVELRYDKKLGPLLLEVNPRLGAGCIIDSIETLTGLNVNALQLSLVLGKASTPKVLSRKSKRYALAALFSPRSGILREFTGLRRVLELPEVRVIRVGNTLGDRIGGDSEEIFLATIFMEAADSKAAWKSYERIKKLVRIRIK
jgi:biotin carboxylase